MESNNAGIRKTSGGGGETTRMLERRVSNNRADLTGDQRMNYFLNWFQGWSELQKSDFVPVLALKMSDSNSSNAIITNDLEKVTLNGGGSENKTAAAAAAAAKAPSLFECQVKLFKDWFSSWSDDQKNYLVLRLQAIDSDFFGKYEAFEARKSPEKDYFEPGVPPELVRKSSKSVLGPHQPLSGAGGGHRATFNAHESLNPESQPKSFMTQMSSDSLNCGHSNSSSSSTLSPATAAGAAGTEEDDDLHGDEAGSNGDQAVDHLRGQQELNNDDEDVLKKPAAVARGESQGSLTTITE